VKRRLNQSQEKLLHGPPSVKLEKRKIRHRRYVLYYERCGKKTRKERTYLVSGVKKMPKKNTVDQQYRDLSGIIIGGAVRGGNA